MNLNKFCNDIKKTAVNAVEETKPADLFIGSMTSAVSAKIKSGDKFLNISKGKLYIPERLKAKQGKKKTVDLKIAGIEGLESKVLNAHFKIDETDGGAKKVDANGEIKYKDESDFNGIIIKVEMEEEGNKGLKVGDRVLIGRFSGGQKYAVIDKL